MPSENSQPEGDLLPFGAPQVDPVDPSVRAKLTKASSGQQKIERNPRALRPLWYSIPILVIVLTVAAYLIGLSLWSRSSLSHWKAQEYDVALAGYDGQMTWTQIGIERWVAHYNRGTTLVRQGQTDEGVTELRTAFDLVPKATEVKPGRLEPFSYECRVRVNLAVGIETQGDAQAAAGSYADAATTYQEAEETVAPCQTASNTSQNQSDDQNQSSNQNHSGDQQQSGNKSDNPADQNKERVEDKKQKAQEQSEEQGDQRKDQQQDQQQDQQDKGSKDQQTNPSPSPSPSQDPYEGESPAEKQRREELQHKNDQRNKDQRNEKDDRRSGNPNGAW
jgi:putative tetratricopeptide repeat-containing domain protein